MPLISSLSEYMGNLYFSPFGGLTLKYFWSYFLSSMTSMLTDPLSPPMKEVTLSYILIKCTIQSDDLLKINIIK